MTAGAVHHVESVMGTAVSFDVRGVADDVAAASIQRAVDWLHHVDETFSTYRIDSEISRFARGEIGCDDLGAEVRDVLAMCIELGRVTGGAFDAFAVPAPNGTMLDPSGYVKGWAVERAAELLVEDGLVDLTVNAGGDVAVRGEAAPGVPWRIGIRHPDQRDLLATVVEAVGPFAIATSATYERGAHIVDPRTGSPTTTLASVTVTGTDLAIVDAYATAAFVMGFAALDWIEDQPGFELYVITHDGTTGWSTGFPLSRA